MGDKKKLLYIEDEVDLGNVVKQYLEIVGFTVVWCQNASIALQSFSELKDNFDLILIDVQLPDFNGFQLAKKINRLSPDQPFLFLTARSEKKDRIEGLNIGADDYIVKPFDIDELILRIKNILKRNGSQRTPVMLRNQQISSIGDIEIDSELHKLHIGKDHTFDLTLREIQLILFFAENEGKLIKREDILIKIWGENDYFMGRSLDVFISRIRKILKHSSKISIETVYGSGFIFKCS